MPLVIRQIIKFSLTGLVGFIVDFGGYFTLTRSIPLMRTYYIATSVLTSFIAIGIGYLVNRSWTFRDPSAASIGQYSRYLAVYGIGSMGQNTLLALFVEWFYWPDLIAKMVAVLMIAFGWNFLLAKKWVFRYNAR